MPAILPPPQYDHTPAMPVLEQVRPLDEVDRRCRAAAPVASAAWEHIGGCTWLKKDGKCYILRVDDPNVRRHELAHCNGWPQDHPGGQWSGPSVARDR